MELDQRRANMVAHVAIKQARKEIRETIMDEARSLRAGIDGERCLRVVSEAAVQLYLGYEVIKDATGADLQVPLSRERVASLKAASDIHMALLKKVLPDLQQVDVTVEASKMQKFNLTIDLSGDKAKAQPPSGDEPAFMRAPSLDTEAQKSPR